MKAGRELDALVAEKVMGHGSRWNFMPSTDLDDAWKVVQQVLTWKHGHVDLSIESGGTCCTISSYERDGQATAPSVPLAICLAALNAMESPS